MAKKYFSTLLLAVTPLVFAPFTLNFFATNKQFFVIMVGLALVAMAAVRLGTTNKLELNRSSLSWAMLAFWVVAILNIVFTPEARTESLINRGSLFLVLPLVSYLLASDKKIGSALRWALSAIVTVGTILAIWGLVQLLLISGLSAAPSWMQSLNFTPAGSPLVLLTVLVISGVMAAIWGVSESDLNRKTMLLTAGGVQLVAIAAYAYLLLQGEVTVQLLPLRAGWSIALDALKSGRQLLLGIGFANFTALYTQAKPAFLAQTDLWNIVFQSSSNELFYLISTMGLLGVGAFLGLMWVGLRASLRLANTPTNMALKWGLYLVIASFIVLPASVVTYTWFFVLLGLISASGYRDEVKEVELKSPLGLISAGLIALLVAVGAYFSTRVYAAEVNMRRAQTALEAGRTQQVYDSYVRAIQLVPTNANYRVSFSQINLSLASNLSQQEELTEEQRNQVTQLVQRAIEQAQTAVQLRPSLSSNWQNLGMIYRNLINVAQGSENFAIQYMGQAVAQHPTDPLLRVEYGGLFYQLAILSEDLEGSDPEVTQTLLDQSVQQFQIAAQLRPNYANAYYNLSKSFEQRGNYRLAYQALTQAMANLDPESVDYETAQAELLALEEKLPAETSEAADPVAPTGTEQTLEEAEPLPSPLPGGPIEIPANSAQ